MKKLMSKLVAFALVATLAFALTGCFVTPNSAITFNKYPEATYVAGTSENSALSSIVVTLTENGTKVKEGNLADLEKEGVIVVEGFDLKTEGPKTAKIIFGTAVVSFHYTVVAESVAINDEAKLVEVLSSTSEETVVASLGKDITLAAALTASAKHVVLDLNGKKLTAGYASGEAMFTVEAGAKLEVKNGTIENRQLRVAGIFAAAGELIIHSGTYTDYGQFTDAETLRIGGELIAVLDGGALTIYGGTFNAEYDANVAAVPAEINNYGREAVYVYAGASAKIYGGKFTNTSKDGATDQDGDGNKDHGSYLLNSEGDTFIYGGDFYGARGALGLVAGQFDVRGGKFDAGIYYAVYVTGSYAEVSGIISGGEFISGTFCVVYTGNTSNVEGGIKAQTDLVITGGVFKHKKATAIRALNGSATIASVLVKGGEWHNVADNSFSLMDSEGKYTVSCIAKDYTAVKENGVWTVKAI